MNKVIEMRIEDNKILLIRNEKVIIDINSESKQIVKAEDLVKLFDYSYGDSISLKPFDEEKFKDSKLCDPAKLFFAMLEDIVNKIPSLVSDDDNTKDIKKCM